MNIEKIGLAICVVLIVCLAGFSGWNYLRIDDLPKQIADLEAQNDQLESQVVELEAQVENLTNMMDAIVNNFTFVTIEQLLIVNLEWATLNAYATLTIQNTGTADLTVVAITVNDESALIEPTTLNLAPAVQGTIKVAGILFLSGQIYEFALITAIGNTFPYTATAP